MGHIKCGNRFIKPVHIRRKFFQGSQQRRKIQDEDSAVPHVFSVGDVGFGKLKRGLFLEPADLTEHGLGSEIHFVANLDITIPCHGCIRFDPDRDNMMRVFRHSQTVRQSIVK